MTDFKKLSTLASIMGVKVVERARSKDDAGTFVYDREKPYIELFSGGRKTHEDILVLLHELGHAMDWAEMGRPDEREIPNALIKAEEKLKPADRRIVYEYEKRAIANMKLIYQLLNLSLPLWKLEVERRFDLWIAQTLLKTGKYPTKAERKAFRLNLQKTITQNTIHSLSLI